MTTAITRINW